MTMITDANQSYMELTKADLEAFAAQMSGAMAQMQDMMKNLPPEQRAKYEAMMKARGGGAAGAAPAAKPEFKKVGTGTVGKWTCDKYEGYTNGQKTHEMCTVDPKALGLTPADFQVTRDMMEFFQAFQKLQPGGGQPSSQMFMLGAAQDGFSGIPVRSVTTTNGHTVTFEISDVSRQAFPESTFQVPAGYKKVDMTGGMGRRGR
jgi:hypothetical protein